MEGMSSQFQPVNGGPGGPKFVVVAISVLILVMFISLIGLAIVSNG
jgi:hypothetical protein